MHSDKVQALRQWMIQRGCKIHPNIDIPSRVDGVLGVASTAPLPHKTLILAIPTNLVLTTTRCYNDPKLKKLFQKNDDLFDYQSSEDAQFNILCVFMMYHRINADGSEWRPYFEAMSEPETALDWSIRQLAGLNKSIIEEVVLVKRQCVKLGQELIAYLRKRKQFAGVEESVLRQQFHFCYRSVMTRSFGYYFGQTCLIPGADLFNHSCDVVDHQIINVNFENDREFQEGYFPRREKFDCQLLDLRKPDDRSLPFREQFLVEKGIVEGKQEVLAQLDRAKIKEYLHDWNRRRLAEGQGLEGLNFCSEDEQEDNDTDQDFQAQKQRELSHCHLNQRQQMTQFVQNYVTVQRYEDVQKKLQQMDTKNSTSTEKAQELKIQKEQQLQKTEINQLYQFIKQQKQKTQSQKTQTTSQKGNNSIQQNLPKINKQAQTQQKASQNNTQKLASTSQPQKKPNPFSNSSGRGVPIQLLPSDSEQESDDENQWNLKQGSYFTMVTSSPVPANKQIFYSYGSRTNKFLLVWYGFAYPDNLYDSVTLRLHVQFGPLRPAREIVLDTYVGGQGRSFRKNEHQMVKQTELSRQFRLKRSKISEKMLIFLRLFLMNYYKGEDLYKLFVTFPASVDFQIFVWQYYRDIVQALYDRYPEGMINQLQQQMEIPENQNMKYKIKYKVIYLTEQRKLLDLNLKATNAILEVLAQCKTNGGVLKRQMYASMPIGVIRIIKDYLLSYQKQMPYILYKQGCQEMQNQQTNKKIIQKQSNKGQFKQQRPQNQIKERQTINDKQAKEQQEEWQDEQDEQQSTKPLS